MKGTGATDENQICSAAGRLVVVCSWFFACMKLFGTIICVASNLAVGEIAHPAFFGDKNMIMIMKMKLTYPRNILVWLFGAVALFMGSRVAASISFENSIVPVEGAVFQGAQPGVRMERTFGRVVRTALTPQELDASMRFNVILKSNNLDKLKARIAKGEVLSRAQLEAYLPSKEDYNEVRAWLESKGFKITLDADTRHAVFAEGASSRVAAAFGVTLARVTTADGEFTSAISVPQIPDAIAIKVAGIRGLQPHLIRHPRTRRLPHALTVPGYYAITPAAVTTAYNTPVNLTGSGQTIAIIGDAVPANSDLTTFWSQCGISQFLNNVTIVNVSGGPKNSSTGNRFEVSMDVQWSSGVAPGAKVRVYATPFPLDSTGEAAAFTQLLNDLAKDTSIHQVSESYGGIEDASVTQYDPSLILLTAQGVTCFASSGDWGSNPYTTDQNAFYSSSAALAVNYPASDPSVTAVGGTILAFPRSMAGTVQLPEVAWSLNGDLYATGGGESQYFARPAWQVAPGMPTGTHRCVPDVAAMADFGDGSLNLAPIVFLGGVAYRGSGTSLSSPMWAGFSALINQARANASLSAVGFLNPKLYAAAGTSAFNDITYGSIGAYSAGVGYDLCTGVGTPNMTNLITYLVQTNQAAAIVTQPSSVSVCVSHAAQFSITAFGYPLPTYQWQRLPAGGSAWVGLSDDTVYSGSTTSILGVGSPTLATSGDQFRCLVSNSGANLTSIAASLTVTAATMPSISGLSSTMNRDSGNTLELNPTVSGVEPITYQWSKDGLAISGATTAHYIKSPLTTADSGQYVLTATNNLGSATFTVIATVNLAIAPSISGQATTVTLDSGGQLNMAPIVDGAWPMTNQWSKDGTQILGENWALYSKGNVTTADAGQYTLTATNVAGKATYTVNVIVKAANNSSSSSSGGGGSSSGGGGGGAPGAFYILSLVLVGGLRRFIARNR
jgi:kumamolisin